MTIRLRANRSPATSSGFVQRTRSGRTHTACLPRTPRQQRATWLSGRTTRCGSGDVVGEPLCSVGVEVYWAQVSPVPEAMEQVKWNFGALAEGAEVDYINAKMNELCGGHTPVALSAEEARLAIRTRDSNLHDELAPPSAANPSRCLLCPTPHWRPANPAKFLPQELVPLLQRASAPGAAVAAAPTAALPSVPMLPTPADVDAMSAAIAFGHRFVRGVEGDRYACCVCRGWCFGCSLALCAQFCEPTRHAAGVQGVPVLLGSPSSAE